MKTELRRLLAAKEIPMQAVADHLDGLAPAERLAEVRSVGLRQQRRLFNAAKDSRPIDFDHLCPAAVGEGVVVWHQGKNSLPIFSTFRKPMIRPAEGAADLLWGYNDTPWLVRTFVGPGYFAIRRNEQSGELIVDYARIPDRAPAPGWPPVLPNHARLSYFVFHNVEDVLRGVSRHVTIGRASRGGRALPSWFILCREG
jgi:hypothetical protein